MTVNTTNITGFVVLPNDTVREKSSVIFRMTGFDTDADQDAVVVPYPITAPILSNGSINVRLWPNPEGVRTTFYQVTASLYNGVNPVSVNLGQISVPVTGGPYDLNDLLPVAPPAGASVEDYIAFLAAATVSSQASADAAAASAADALSDAVRAEAAADLAEFYVPSIRPVVPLEPIISDGTLTSLTISGVYISADQIELYVGGVIQPARDEYYTITAGATTTVLTFPAVEEGLEVYYRAMRQIAVPVADPGEIDFPDGSTATDVWRGFTAFASRSAAEAATLTVAVDRIWVRVSNGDTLAYKRDATGTAITTADGANWSPDGDAYLEHYGGFAGAVSTVNAAAWLLAYAKHDTVCFRDGFYAFGSDGFVIEKPGFTIAANGGDRTFLNFSGATTNGIKFQPANLTNGSYLSGPKITGKLVVLGSNASSTTGVGVTFTMVSNADIDNLNVQGFANPVRVRGGQLNRFHDLTCFGRTGGSIADVTGTSLLEIGPHTPSGFDARPIYTTTFGNVFIVGDADKNVEHAIKIGGADGVQFGSGYVGFGRTSNLYFEPAADGTPGNITAFDTGRLYFDGVSKVDGTEYGVLFGSTAFTGTISHVRIGAGTFVGNYQKSAVYSRSNCLRGLYITGANISGCSERVLDIVGTTGATGTRLVIGGGTAVRSGDLGGVKVNGCAIVHIDDTSFFSNDGDGAITLSGTIDELVLGQNSFLDNAADVTNTSTALPRGGVMEYTSVPTIVFGGASVGITYSVQTCDYSVIGNRVFANARIVLTSKGTSTGEMAYRLNIPTKYGAKTNAAGSVVVDRVVSGAADKFVQAEVLAPSTTVRVSEIGTGGAGDVRVIYTDAQIQDDSEITVSANWAIS